MLLIESFRRIIQITSHTAFIINQNIQIQICSSLISKISSREPTQCIMLFWVTMHPSLPGRVVITDRVPFSYKLGQYIRPLAEDGL